MKSSSTSIIILLLLFYALLKFSNSNAKPLHRAQLHSLQADNEQFRRTIEEAIRRGLPACDYRLLFRPWPLISTVCALGKPLRAWQDSSYTLIDFLLGHYNRGESANQTTLFKYG